MLSYAKSRYAGSRLFVLFAVTILPLYTYGQTEVKKLCLKDAIEIGLKNNPEVRSAKNNISASNGRFWSGISLPQPEIGVSYEYAPVSGSLSNYGERTVEVKQSFEFPTNYFLKGNKFGIEENISTYKLTLTEKSIITRIKTNYYRVLAKQHQLKWAEDNLSISEDFFKKAEIKLNVGEGTNLEKLTARVQYSEALNNLENIRNELTNAIAELNYTLGLGKESFDSNYSLTDSLVYIDSKINTDQIYKSLEETNPQIKIAELNYGISSVEKKLAWSSLLPNINLAYFRQQLDGDNGFYGASFGISVPLWFMFDQRGKIQEANANQSILESELQLTKNEIALKLKNAFGEYENNLKQVKLYKDDILPQANEIYRSAIKSYDAGELTYLEYLQAKQTLISSRNNYINALFNQYQSIFRIEEISGQSIIEKSELEK